MSVDNHNHNPNHNPYNALGQFAVLPPEIIYNIFDHCPNQTVETMQKVNSEFLKLANNYLEQVVEVVEVEFEGEGPP